MNFKVFPTFLKSRMKKEVGEIFVKLNNSRAKSLKRFFSFFLALLRIIVPAQMCRIKPGLLFQILLPAYPSLIEQKDIKRKDQMNFCKLILIQTFCLNIPKAVYVASVAANRNIPHLMIKRKFQPKHPKQSFVLIIGKLFKNFQ